MARKKAEEMVETKKKKIRGRGGNNFLTDAALNVESGDNAKYIRLGMEIMMMPKIDLDDAPAVQERLREYFAIYTKYDTKPTVAGMASALGISRQELWAIANDKPLDGTGRLSKLNRFTTDSIKKAYTFLAQLWEIYMQNGKINPVSGIFLGKNNYGYSDKTEYVVTPNVKSENDFSAEDIRKRYMLEGGMDDGDQSTESDS